MKEAGRTSILSKRWRYVWANIHVLNFDASDTMEKLMLSEEEDLLEKEKPRYLSWVNQVVRSYKGPTIDEFRVQFDISAASQNIIDNWIKFALEKSVKKLELDFKPHGGGAQDVCCTFSDLLFCNSLTSLQLADVDVTGEVLQNFLNSCPGLEYLSIRYSESLENLEVSGPTLNLKYLEIIYCFEIKHIEIYAPNLVSFKYFGPKISMPLKWTPKLVELSIGGKYGVYLTNNFLEISSNLSQLESLRLDLMPKLKHVMKSVDQFPPCEKLKELEIKVNPEFDENLFCLVPLLKACPNLHKFVLKLYWTELDDEGDVGVAVEAFPLSKLKVVEVVGFLGHEIDTEFIVYLIENSVSLEKIIINPFKTTSEGTPWESLVEERQIKARKQAEQLRTKLKRGIDLIIL